MSLHKKNEFEGKDVAEAISKACKALNVSQEQLDIEVLSTGTSGIFGLCSKKACLRVAVKEEFAVKGEERPRKKKPKPQKEKAASVAKKKEDSAREKKSAGKPKPSAKPRETKIEDQEVVQLSDELLADVKSSLNEILKRMDFSSEVSVSSDNENATALIKGDYVDDIVAQNGKLLDSLQYVLRKIIGKKYSEKAIISLDAGDFRATRKEELKQLGLELAAEVKKSGKTRSIPSLNPSERRVVHLILQDDKDVRSRSVGEGLFKKVLIYRPGSKGKKGPGRRRKGSRNKKQ